MLSVPLPRLPKFRAMLQGEQAPEEARQKPRSGKGCPAVCCPAQCFRVEKTRRPGRKGLGQRGSNIIPED